MADSNSDLTPTQRHSLEQLRELTNGADDEVSIGVLGSVGWDVQKAAELIFEGGGVHGINVNASANASTSSASTSGIVPEREEFEIDDSEVDTAPLIGPGGGPRRNHPPPGRPLISLFSFPLTLLTSLFRFVFHILRFPFTFILSPRPRGGYGFLGLGLSLGSSLGSLGRGRGGRSGAPGITGVEKWVRELEEETGAVCLGGIKSASASTSGAATSSNVANGSLNARSGGGPSFGASTSTAGAGKPQIAFNDQTKKYLPEFQLCTYEDLLKTCQREMRVACVVLVSEEHDDVPEFKRSTLTDPTLLKTLYDNDILVWGGDVRDREAWSASEKLQATTYPFVAFVSLQPRRDPGSSSSSQASPPVLTVLSRHQGPSYSSSSSSSSPAPPTSAQTLTTHLTTSLLPRVQPYLGRLHSQAAQRTRDREIRAEQDRMFKEAERRDRERIEGAMRREREAREAKEQEARVARERALWEEMERRDREERREMAKKRRDAVKGWVKTWLGKSSSANGSVQGGLRIAIRLPSGKREIELFEKAGTVTALYARVESLLDASPSSDIVREVKDDEGKVLLGWPALSRDTEGALEAYITSSLSSEDPLDPYTYPDPVYFWGFTIATAFPRVEIPWQQNVMLEDVARGALNGGGQVVVELLNGNGNGREAEGRQSTEGRQSVDGPRRSLEAVGGSVRDGEAEDSDEYDTESSEE